MTKFGGFPVGMRQIIETCSKGRHLRPYYTTTSAALAAARAIAATKAETLEVRPLQSYG